MKKNKKSILLIGAGGDSWIGGLYYIKNIAFALLQNEYITKNYHIILLCDKSAKEIFDVFTQFEHITIKYVNVNKRAIKHLSILYFGFFASANYIFPSKININKHIKGIAWIPDFQYLHFPENFSKELVEIKNKDAAYLADNNIPVILSSNDSLNDYVKNYAPTHSNGYVVHFVSYIEKEIEDISPDYANGILNKYHLQKAKYIFVTNQFWKHKNHRVVLDAIRIISKSEKSEKIKFIFSGKFEDYRNPDYIKDLQEKFSDPCIKRYSENLGFLPRREQLTIMKNARFIIQPSLSEGWGTVLEDAKVLDKRVILSDIPVHREQMNDRCLLFDPRDPEDLAEKILYMLDMPFDDNVMTGIENMYDRAKEYSKAFEQCLRNNPL